MRKSFSHWERAWLGGGRTLRDTGRLGTWGCGRGWNGTWTDVGIGGVEEFSKGALVVVVVEVAVVEGAWKRGFAGP